MSGKKISVLIVSAFLLSGCRWFGHESVKLSGTLEMTEHSVGTRLAGRIDEMLVEEGQTLHKNDLIATLDRYEQTKKDYERLLEISKQGGVDRQTLEHAALDVADHQVHSPVNGLVLVKVRESGEVVAAGQPIAVVGDSEKIWVRIYVPESMVNRVQIGNAATVRFDGLKRVYKGHVSTVAPKAEFTPRNIQTTEERVTQTFAVKVSLDEKDLNIHPGVAADVDLELKG